MRNLVRQAHGVLFPVLVDLHLHDDILRFLDAGGRALLFGETGEEYASGRMSAARMAEETAERWRATLAHAHERAGPLLVAADADVSAVHRLHRLTPPLPSLYAAQRMPAAQFESVIRGVAQAARTIGVNLLLSPTADVVAGPNPWLAGRTLGDDIATVSRLVQSYVRAAQAAGVACALKHFPGHPVLTGHPATQEAHVPASLDELRPYLAPFNAGIAAGASAVMMGPAIFGAVTPPAAGSISPRLIALLRRDCGFGGLVITCDLDHKATRRDHSVADTAVIALAAGADLLLLAPPSVPAIESIAHHIARAVHEGRLSHQRLADAAGKVADLIHRLPHP